MSYPGAAGSIGPFPGQYSQPHVYARDIHSGAGNCICGWPVYSPIHVEIIPGMPNPELETD